MDKKGGGLGRIWRRLVRPYARAQDDLSWFPRPASQADAGKGKREAEAKAQKTPFFPAPVRNLQHLKERLAGSGDLVTREFTLQGQPFGLAYIDGLADRQAIHALLRALMFESPGEASAITPDWVATRERLARTGLPISEVKEAECQEKALTAIVGGEAVLYGPAWERALLLGVRGWERRAVTEPDTEAVVRGPREGFTENLRTNTALLRRKLRTADLIIEERQMGRITQTAVSLAYLRGAVDHQVLAEARARLARIDLDSILETGYLEEFLEDAPFSPFPQMVTTERPDRVAEALMRGKIAFFCDGTPFVLMCPCTMNTFLQTPEDYYNRWLVSLGIRLFRAFGILIATLLPAIYVALTTFHQELIPTSLAVSLASQREGVPYPAVVEALFMQVVFEVLSEAGIRLPKQMGQAISIVGALVIGEASVRAGFASNTMVIVIAMTAIASFVIPTYSFTIAVRMIRLPLILIAASLGFFGLFAAMLGILIHLVTLRSFGEPYLSPFAPLIWEDLKDTFIRVPWWAMLTRPKLTNQANFWRQRPGGAKRILPKEKRGPEMELEARLEGKVAEKEGLSPPRRFPRPPRPPGKKKPRR